MDIPTIGTIIELKLYVICLALPGVTTFRTIILKKKSELSWEEETELIFSPTMSPDKSNVIAFRQSKIISQSLLLI